jgi:hypothetical protein
MAQRIQNHPLLKSWLHMEGERAVVFLVDLSSPEAQNEFSLPQMAAETHQPTRTDYLRGNTNEGQRPAGVRHAKLEQADFFPVLPAPADKRGLSRQR